MAFMSKVTVEEIESSINLLTEYNDRITQEFLHLAHKLKMPKNKIEQTLENHSELKKVKAIISRLNKEKKSLES